MRPFEYAAPETEAEAIALIADQSRLTAVLAGGTDLVSLMQQDVVRPDRVVNIKNVDSMKGIETDGDGLLIGALTTLEELTDSPLTTDYRSLGDVAAGIRAIQVQQNGTIGGDLCLMPNCWYFRNGHGLLAMENGESLVEAGDNRYHAIFGNSGPARFVSASRLAPALIAWDAQVRVIGPQPNEEKFVPLEHFYVSPRTESQGLTLLQPGQLISHVRLPSVGGFQSAAYEALEMNGLDWPLAAASSCVAVENGIVRRARIVMGHVAPTPWIANEAAQSLVGYPINEGTASRAGQIAVAAATPMSDNGYKVAIAKAAVKRALLKSVNQLNLEPAGAGGLV